MRIDYENFKAEKYAEGSDETYGSFFRSSDVNVNLSPTKINLYNTRSDAINDEKIYLELANATTLDAALKFTNKYGKLVENDTLKEVYTIIENGNFNSTQSAKYDYVLYNHFLYYQQTMYNLIQIYKLLQQESHTPNDIESLFYFSYNLICNRYFEEKFYLEFPSFYNVEDTIESLSDYPLLRFIYITIINKDKTPKMSRNDSSFYMLKFFHNFEDISAFFSSIDNQEKMDELFSNYPLDQYLHEVHEKMSIPYKVPLDGSLTPPIQFFIKTLDYANNKKLPSDYLIIHKSDFINLANFVFSQILTFEIRFTQPTIDLKSIDAVSCWHFNSLSNAIFFNYYVDTFYGTTFKVCENSYCKKLFVYSPSKPTQKYCCHGCAHKVTNRKHKMTHE